MVALFFTIIACAQQKRKTHFPIGLYTKSNTTIYGISVGVGSNTYQNSDSVSVRSNGIRIEPISQALLIATLIFGPDQVNYPDGPIDFDAFDKKFLSRSLTG